MRQFLFWVPLLLIAMGCNTEPVVNKEAKKIYTGVSTNSWAVMPAGEFFYGMHNHDTLIDYDYEMMKTQVTNKQYADYLEKTLSEGTIKIVDNEVQGYYPGEPFDGYNHEKKITEGYKLHLPLDEPGNHINHENGKFSVDKGFENHPVVMVTWFGAKAYADFMEYRLPTELEWAKAARGKEKRPYPWGHEIETDVANYTHKNSVLEKILDTKVVRTTPVGFYNGKTYSEMQTRDNQSPYGLYDMAGNVWEWVADDYADTHYRYMRGGSFTNYGYKLTVWARNSAGPGHYSFNTGFRCVRDVSE